MLVLQMLEDTREYEPSHVHTTSTLNEAREMYSG